MGKFEKRHEFPERTVSCRGFSAEEVQKQIDFLMKEKDFEPKYVRFEDVQTESEKNPDLDRLDPSLRDLKKAWDKQLTDLYKIVSSYKRPKGLTVWMDGVEVPEGGEFLL